MFYALKAAMENAMKTNQAVVCVFNRRQYLLVDMDSYWREARLLRKTAQSIARYQANQFEYGDEKVLTGDDFDNVKIIGLAACP